MPTCQGWHISMGEPERDERIQHRYRQVNKAGHRAAFALAGCRWSWVKNREECSDRERIMPPLKTLSIHLKSGVMRFCRLR